MKIFEAVKNELSYTIDEFREHWGEDKSNDATFLVTVLIVLALFIWLLFTL